MKDDGNCKYSRRDFLCTGVRSGTALAFSQLLGLSMLFADENAKTKSCIVLWMTGGPSQFETFDPKPETSTGGEFKAIGTSVNGIRISEHLPLLAKEMNDIAVLRSMTSREGNHDRARYFVHTGYSPAGVTQHPSFGAIVAKELMAKSQRLPAYISINGPAIPAGLLGMEFSPFVIRDPGKPPENLSIAGSVSKARFEKRNQLLEQINATFGTTHSQKELEMKDMIYQRAIDLMNSPALNAFDISLEKDSVRKSYGDTKIGNGCLMARRLIQKGVKFVEVEMDGWDTHHDNFNRTKQLLHELDPAYSSLLRDLRRTGLLESTIVLWMGEFGRTPEINSNGGRDHWPQAWSAAVAGGGIRGGQIVGSTDAKGYEVNETPVTIPDLYATISKCLGIDDSKYNSSPLGRPIRITDQGKIIQQLIG